MNRRVRMSKREQGKVCRFGRVESEEHLLGKLDTERVLQRRMKRLSTLGKFKNQTTKLVQRKSCQVKRDGLNPRQASIR